jgi:hypothetical protein
VSEATHVQMEEEHRKKTAEEEERKEALRKEKELISPRRSPVRPPSYFPPNPSIYTAGVLRSVYGSEGRL